MKGITGRVVDGKIEFETALKEGTPVAVLAAGDSGFRSTAEEEEELVASREAIRSGKYEDGYEVRHPRAWGRRRGEGQADRAAGHEVGSWRP